MLDPKAFGAAVGAQIKLAVAQAVAGMSERLGGIVERMNTLEASLKAIPAGPKGETGDPGPSGPAGPKGQVGEKGEKGADGLPGKDGRDGEPGPAGVQGERGEKGEKGDKGDPGEKGDRGDRGEKGDTGERGPDGAAGRPGEKGERGERGEKGEPGQDGRDGLQIEVLDGIDTERRYLRNTYVIHRGGLLRARRNTEPLAKDADHDALDRAGWQVILNGIAQATVEASDDMRTITMGLVMTDGSATTKTISVPVVIERGIYRDDQPYEKGDGTTWDGCFWIAQRNTLPGEKPGDASGAWRMAVKKGRDGLNGLRGEKGERGAEGRAGRDLTQMTFDGKKF